MLGIFIEGPWHSIFITAKYEYSTQNSFSVKPKFAGKCGQSPQTTLLSVQFISQHKQSHQKFTLYQYFHHNKYTHQYT